MFAQDMRFKYELHSSINQEKSQLCTFPSGFFLLAAISFTSLGICLLGDKMRLGSG